MNCKAAIIGKCDTMESSYPPVAAAVSRTSPSRRSVSDVSRRSWWAGAMTGREWGRRRDCVGCGGWQAISREPLAACIMSSIHSPAQQSRYKWLMPRQLKGEFVFKWQPTVRRAPAAAAAASVADAEHVDAGQCRTQMDRRTMREWMKGWVDGAGYYLMNGGPSDGSNTTNSRRR